MGSTNKATTKETAKKKSWESIWKETKKKQPNPVSKTTTEEITLSKCAGLALREILESKNLTPTKLGTRLAEKDGNGYIDIYRTRYSKYYSRGINTFSTLESVCQEVEIDLVVLLISTIEKYLEFKLKQNYPVLNDIKDSLNTAVEIYLKFIKK